MNPSGKLRNYLRGSAYLGDQIDTGEAAERIKSNIWFRGPNVWILAFSIVIASVGLNVNSTAVIIGAMLISPLMGPIMGVGLALGTNDTEVLKHSAWNLLVMVVISLVASSLYFLISPLELANPTELAARTHPSIYDVLIAFFGGLAGIVESARREKGTVLSGVAIATALMPPLCTAGYGLATGNLHYFLGASFLFLINGTFIILATYLMVELLGFHDVEFADARTARRRKAIIALFIVAVIIPSVWSAILMVRENNFERNVHGFVAANKTFSKGYIYDYEIVDDVVNVYVIASEIDPETEELLMASAARYGLGPDQVVIKDNAFVHAGSAASEELIRGLNERAEMEISRKEAEVKALERQVAQLRGDDIPYTQIVREIRYQFPSVSDVFLSRGALVSGKDSLAVHPRLQVLVSSTEPLSSGDLSAMEEWLRVRMDDTTLVVSPLPKL